jgi:hypothetical protein
MPLPHYDNVRDTPLPTDRELVPLLQNLLERANRRQAWVMLLDQESRPLPDVIPTGLPEEPEPDDVVGVRDFLTCIALDFDRATLVVTLERPGPAELMDRDRRWLRVLREGCVSAGFPFRGPYLLLGTQVLQVPPDEYIGTPLIDPDDEDEYY